MSLPLESWNLGKAGEESTANLNHPHCSGKIGPVGELAPQSEALREKTSLAGGQVRAHPSRYRILEPDQSCQILERRPCLNLPMTVGP